MEHKRVCSGSRYGLFTMYGRCIVGEDKKTCFTFWLWKQVLVSSPSVAPDLWSAFLQTSTSIFRRLYLFLNTKEKYLQLLFILVPPSGSSFFFTTALLLGSVS